MPAVSEDSGMKTVRCRPDMGTCVCVCHGGRLHAACSLRACGLHFEHTQAYFMIYHTHSRVVTETFKAVDANSVKKI